MLTHDLGKGEWKSLGEKTEKMRNKEEEGKKITSDGNPVLPDLWSIGSKQDAYLKRPTALRSIWQINQRWQIILREDEHFSFKNLQKN